LHLLARVHEREISTEQLRAILNWLEGEPVAPEGSWFKRFQNVTVCGRGELIVTFLRADQTAVGEEMK
jgi:hypothetical protein